MGEPVDKLVEESRAEGTFDSQGQFEIQGDKALEKLMQFTVSRPEQWILKMVQAAVAGGAENLRITQGRWEVSLRFALRDLPTPEEVEFAILHPARPASPFLQELAVGLRSLLLARRFRIGWPARTGHSGLEWTREQFLSDTVKSTPAAFEVTVVYPSNWVSGSYLERAAESRILQTHAAYCPIPLYLDNREVTVHDTPLESNYTDFTSTYPRHVACGYLGTPQSEPVTAVASRLRNPLYSRYPLMRWGRSPGVTRGSFSIFCSHLVARGYPRELFRLVWTRYGVACAAQDIPDAPLGGFLQVSGDHLRADLSGLSVNVEPEDIAQAQAQLSALTPIADQAREWVSGFETRTTLFEMFAYTSIITVGVAVVVMACVAGAGEAIGGLGSIGSTSSGHRDASSMKRDDFPANFSLRLGQLLARGGPTLAPLPESS